MLVHSESLAVSIAACCKANTQHSASKPLSETLTIANIFENLRMKMAPSFCTIIVSGILATRPVLAGSRAWESSIVYTPPSNAGGLLGSITTNATNGTGLYTSPEPLKKRWVTINPGDANSDDHLWPDGKISYCYESTETKELFSKDLVEARILWEDSGLGAGFDWEEKDSSLCVTRRSVVVLPYHYNI
jgi:hypothetical protein